MTPLAPGSSDEAKDADYEAGTREHDADHPLDEAGLEARQLDPHVDQLRIAWIWTSVDEELRAENPVIRYLAEGRQYIALAVGGGADTEQLVALALP